MKIQDSKGRIHTVPKKYEDEIRHYIQSNNHAAVDNHIQKYGWGGIVDGVKDVGLLYGDAFSSLAGLNNLITEKSYTNKGFGKFANDFSNIYGKAMPQAIGMVNPAAGMAINTGQAIGSNFDPKEKTPMEKSHINPVLPYEIGGPVNQTMINVEGNELEVDKMGNIVKDFKNKPPHPVNGIDPRGNIMAEEGNIIIPKKLRNKYLYGDRQTRQAIIKSLSFLSTGTTKMYGGAVRKFEEGGENWDITNPQLDPTITRNPFFKPLYYKGDYADPTGDKNWSYSNTPKGWIGYKGTSAVEYPMNKYPETVNILNSKYDEFQKAGGGGSDAWNNYFNLYPERNLKVPPEYTDSYDPNPNEVPAEFADMYNTYQNPAVTNSPGIGLKYKYPKPWGGGYTGQTKSYMNPANIPNTGLGTYGSSSGPEEPKYNADNIIPYIGDTAQALYNIFSKPEYPDRMRNKEYDKAIRLMQNRRYDISGQLRSNREGLGAFNYAVRNASGGNPGMYLNQMSVGRTNFDAANANAWAQKNNMDNQYMAEEAQLRSTLGAQDTAYNYQNQDDRLLAEATRRNNIFAPMQNIGQNYLKMRSLGTIDEYGPYAVDENPASYKRGYAAALASMKNKKKKNSYI